MAVVSMDDSSLQADSPVVDWLGLWVGSLLELSCIHQMNWVNFFNGCFMMATPETSLSVAVTIIIIV